MPMSEVWALLVYALIALSAVASLYFMRLMPIFPIMAIMLLSRVYFDGVNKFSIGGVNITSLLGALLLGIAIGMVITGLYGIIPFVALLVILYFSNLQAQAGFGPELSDEFVRFASVLGVFFIVLNLRVRPTTKAVLLLIQLMGLVSAVFAIAQLFLGTGMQVQGLTRIAGTMAHPNSAALLYGVALTASVVSFFAGISRRRSMIASFIFAASLLITGSIGGVIAAVVMLSSYGLLAYRVPRRVRSVTVSLVAVTVLGFVLSPLGGARLEEFSTIDVSGGSESNSLEWRLGRWGNILSYWRESPLLGQGFGASTKGAMLNGYPPHNEYVRALVEVGIVGFVLIAVFVCASVWRIKKVASERESESILPSLTLAVLIGMLVNALSENTLMYSVPAYLLALLLGMMWSADSQFENSQPVSKRSLLLRNSDYFITKGGRLIPRRMSVTS
ncbi:polymerase [Arthrobacter sp. ZXY-2]|nr:polymerase [Arthrobacter sp. ZXY-2]